MLKPSLLVLSLSFLTMSFSPLSSDSFGTELDPHAYVRVGHPGPWNNYSNTLVVPSGVVCGGGASSACELYLDIDVNGGNTEDPDLFTVIVYKNNVAIDWYDFYPHHDDNVTETYTGYTGDRFHLAIYSSICVCTGTSLIPPGTSHPSITAELNI